MCTAYFRGVLGDGYNGYVCSYMAKLVNHVCVCNLMNHELFIQDRNFVFTGHGGAFKYVYYTRLS